MRYIKNYSMLEWSRFDIDMQEILCTKYNIRLTDFQTRQEIETERKRKSKERKIQIIKQAGHVMGVMGAGTLQMIQMFSAKPAPKKRRKRKK